MFVAAGIMEFVVDGLTVVFVSAYISGVIVIYFSMVFIVAYVAASFTRASNV